MTPNQAIRARPIAIGCDHNALELKTLLRRHLEERGYEVVDFGVYDKTPADYPEIAESVAEAVQRGSFDRAVLLCGTGAGMALAANKVPGVRAVCAHDPYTAERARASNDAQVITLGSQIVGGPLAVHLIDIWLATEFQGGRSAPKVAKIAALERRYSKVQAGQDAADHWDRAHYAANAVRTGGAPWIGTSWKMNKTRAEARLYTQSLVKTLEAAPVTATVCLFPPFTALSTVCDVARDSSLKVGAQNMHWADDGPYTGEVSALMIKECGAELVEIGHFERRQEFSETDSSVNKKVRSALHHSLTPLICVGETGLERDYSVAEEVVACQVKIALNGVSTDGVPGVIIAYEPGWAIGAKGTEASPLHVNAMHRTIRQAIASQHGRRASEQVHVVYGGSVNNANAAAFALQPEVDGLFIGRAALDVGSFADILQGFCGARPDQKDPTDAWQKQLCTPGTL